MTTRLRPLTLLAIGILIAFVSANKSPGNLLSRQVPLPSRRQPFWGVKKQQPLSTAALSLIVPRGGSEAPAVEEKDDEEEDDDEDEEDEGTSKKDITSMEPVTLLIKTSMNSAIVDHSMEIMAVRTRNMDSLKKTLSRQLPGKPPAEMIRLMHNGQVIGDEILVDELLEDEEEDDDEEEEDEEDGDEKKPMLTLVLDMVPPIDPRFPSELEEHLEEVSTSDLLEAYTLNEAAIWFSSQNMVKEEEKEETDDQEEDETPVSNPTNTPLISFQLRQYANALKSQMEESVFAEDAATLLENPIPPALAELEKAKQPQVRGHRTRAAAVVAGAAASSNVVGLKQTAQHYLNIHWGDTIRNFCLFLFFGWFGGRTVTSRAILLLGAPLCFIIQARPVKLRSKELLYLLLRNPPSIVLSLLPAPQQAMLALSDADAMKMIYGDDAPPLPEEDQVEDLGEDDEVEEDSDEDSNGEDEYDSDDEED